ncbi:hypothetical protein BXY57_2221 [Thermoflavifilum aggregans]|uniref:Uncharacterized protein n=1 Tax=Thermoflavifilum aggregans TaxID=454188 RepID=A0A2M9CXF2_9BACT|nr:hypothetical protein [Thermoflavifilum aggregans]PJJ76591.1 hypothetical protein BXY57_2221 [Thermoflavifilum aggregans]
MKQTATKQHHSQSKWITNPVVLALGVIILSFLLFYVLEHLFS